MSRDHRRPRLRGRWLSSRRRRPPDPPPPVLAPVWGETWAEVAGTRAAVARAVLSGAASPGILRAALDGLSGVLADPAAPEYVTRAALAAQVDILARLGISGDKIVGAWEDFR